MRKTKGAAQLWGKPRLKKQSSDDGLQKIDRNRTFPLA